MKYINFVTAITSKPKKFAKVIEALVGCKELATEMAVTTHFKALMNEHTVDKKLPGMSLFLG